MKLPRAPAFSRAGAQACSDGAGGPVQRLLLASILTARAVRAWPCCPPQPAGLISDGTSSKCNELQNFGPQSFKVLSFGKKNVYFLRSRQSPLIQELTVQMCREFSWTTFFSLSHVVVSSLAEPAHLEPVLHFSLQCGLLR